MSVVAPNRSEPFTDPNGYASSERVRRWIEEITRITNESNSSATNNAPVFVSIDNTTSPYAASDNEYILVDMTAGDVDVTLPASGRLWVSRDGATNTLTLIGTVNGTVNPTINFDKSTATMAYITEWRYV